MLCYILLIVRVLDSLVLPVDTIRDDNLYGHDLETSSTERVTLEQTYQQAVHTTQRRSVPKKCDCACKNGGTCSTTLFCFCNCAIGWRGRNCEERTTTACSPMVWNHIKLGAAKHGQRDVRECSRCRCHDGEWRCIQRSKCMPAVAITERSVTSEAALLFVGVRIAVTLIVIVMHAIIVQIYSNAEQC